MLNLCRVGLIPACAGKTSPAHPQGSDAGAHPRVCGENPGEACNGRCVCGLIPACAGKTSRIAAVSACLRAHPRVCGENSTMALSSGYRAGSSPRVRGKPARSIVSGRIAGLIPACAGKTSRTPSAELCLTAHPRVCGENVSKWTYNSRIKGSSPRVRGKRDGGLAPHLQRGLIPACAGKTLIFHFPIWNTRAHPRVCGENPSTSGFELSICGSSPRVRGKPRH